VRTLVRYGEGHGTLVETGTYLGDTTAGCLAHFQRIYTIELDPALAENARGRFKDQPTVTVVEGDSAAQLEKLLPSLNGGTVFWLDAHSCGEHTAKGELPLLAEL
jgi:16S rRNA A1518/A1519 N6-dimethyltransferase RsmA/KsgA/DIM1 with predicted DNA glycosylase/AP lyase activity